MVDYKQFNKKFEKRDFAPRPVFVTMSYKDITQEDESKKPYLFIEGYIPNYSEDLAPLTTAIEDFKTGSTSMGKDEFYDNEISSIRKKEGKLSFYSTDKGLSFKYVVSNQGLSNDPKVGVSFKDTDAGKPWFTFLMEFERENSKNQKTKTLSFGASYNTKDKKPFDIFKEKFGVFKSDGKFDEVAYKNNFNKFMEQNVLADKTKIATRATTKLILEFLDNGVLKRLPCILVTSYTQSTKFSLGKLIRVSKGVEEINGFKAPYLDLSVSNNSEQESVLSEEDPNFKLLSESLETLSGLYNVYLDQQTEMFVASLKKLVYPDSNETKKEDNVAESDDSEDVIPF
jgi:hypothetical protein